MTLAAPASTLLSLGLFLTARRPPIPEARELRDVLLTAPPLDASRLDALIDVLAAKRVPCEIGGGLWRAAYTRGETPRWRIGSNVAGQAYDQRRGLVVNYGELLGPSLHFAAQGSFSAREPRSSRCPKDFDVSVESGGLVVLGRPLFSDAISGPGALRVLYVDSDIRIFETLRDSPNQWEARGLQVVQVREELFPEPRSLDVDAYR